MPLWDLQIFLRLLCGKTRGGLGLLEGRENSVFPLSSWCNNWGLRSFFVGGEAGNAASFHCKWERWTNPNMNPEWAFHWLVRGLGPVLSLLINLILFYCQHKTEEKKYVHGFWKRHVGTVHQHDFRNMLQSENWS